MQRVRTALQHVATGFAPEDATVGRLQSLAADRAVPLGCALSLHGVLCCYL